MDAMEEEDSIIDVINESLGEIITKAQDDANTAAQIAISKREEAEAAELAAQEAKDQIAILQQQSQVQELANDEAWQAIYHRLRVWSKEKGNCDPRRNWKSKIDAEEKVRVAMCIFEHMMCTRCVTVHYLIRSVYLISSLLSLLLLHYKLLIMHY